MASPVIDMNSTEELIGSYEVFVSEMLSTMFPIVIAMASLMIGVLLIRTALTDYSTPTRSTPMPSNIPAPPKQPEESSTKSINLTKAPKLRARPLHEWILANDAPIIQSALKELHEVSSLITTHQTLLPIEQNHLYETLQRDLRELLLSYDELQIDSSKQKQHIPVLLDSLQSIKKKMDVIQQVIFETKEFRFYQKVAHIEHR